MIQQLQSALARLILLCMAAAVAENLMPEGAPRRVGRMACALVLLCAVLSPLGELDLETVAGAAVWQEEILQQTQQLEYRQSMAAKPIIEQAYAAYIQDKAAQLGCPCQAVFVELVLQDGLFLPSGVELRGTLSRQQEQHLSAVLAEELGLPPGKVYVTKEAEG